MASFSIPLTGLNADSTALNTIANNLANMNTTSFKSESTSFSDLFYQQIGNAGSGDPIQVGAGVQVAANETDFSQGSISSTGTATDVALNGNGFFVVADGMGAYDYSRAGDFTLTSTGQLVTTDGLNVMGYPATNGIVNTNAPLAAINIPVGQVQQPQATSSLNLTANLDATATAGTTFPGQVTVYDSLGVPHIATITFTETAANTWNYSAALPSADFASGLSTPITGSLAFDSSGNLASTTSGGVTTPVGTAAGDTGAIPLMFTGLADGATDLHMNWNLLDAGGSPTLSQVNASSAVSATTQNGFAPGQYESFTIGSDGTVTVTYSNGQKENVAQLALANVTNEQGLQKLGNGDYATTLASGTASVSTSGSAGLGAMQDGALEGSNVNISAEFSDLIIAQRAFEANSKAVTTFDTVTQETINMIH
ncbi:MAG TPA: flagellar hook protein FlgE [Terracidiphilus sp.]|jgi:flagellar hook protein FlgE|nr:flagellar hook protein FlgE [Terracidiphilus sp.]